MHVKVLFLAMLRIYIACLCILGNETLKDGNRTT